MNQSLLDGAWRTRRKKRLSSQHLLDPCVSLPLRPCLTAMTPPSTSCVVSFNPPEQKSSIWATTNPQRPLWIAPFKKTLTPWHSHPIRAVTSSTSPTFGNCLMRPDVNTSASLAVEVEPSRLLKFVRSTSRVFPRFTRLMMAAPWDSWA